MLENHLEVLLRETIAHAKRRLHGRPGLVHGTERSWRRCLLPKNDVPIRASTRGRGAGTDGRGGEMGRGAGLGLLERRAVPPSGPGRDDAPVRLSVQPKTGSIVG